MQSRPSKPTTRTRRLGLMKAYLLTCVRLLFDSRVCPNSNEPLLTTNRKFSPTVLFRQRGSTITAETQVKRRSGTNVSRYSCVKNQSVGRWPKLCVGLVPTSTEQGNRYA